MRQLRLFALVLPLAFSQGSLAETFVQDFSLTLLRGEDYEVGDNGRWVGTFEYLNVSSWGDVFFFADRLLSDNGDTETYAELQPRLKLANLSEQGLVKSALLATQWEIAENGDNLLVGPGVDLQLPGFQYFQLNLYRRFNDVGENNWQLTPVWGIPFKVGSTRWLYDGFIDWTSGVDGAAHSFNFTSQLKLDLAPYLKASKPVYVGIEYVHWTNKFGIDGVDERNLNLLLKVHL